MNHQQLFKEDENITSQDKNCPHEEKYHCANGQCTKCHRAKLTECPICCKANKTITALKFHMRIHTGEKPCICKQCGQGFATPSQKTVHERRVCKVEGPCFQSSNKKECSMCGAMVRDLKIHLQANGCKTRYYYDKQKILIDSYKTSNLTNFTDQNSNKIKTLSISQTINSTQIKSTSKPIQKTKSQKVSKKVKQVEINKKLKFIEEDHISNLIREFERKKKHYCEAQQPQSVPQNQDSSQQQSETQDSDKNSNSHTGLSDSTSESGQVRQFSPNSKSSNPEKIEIDDERTQNSTEYEHDDHAIKPSQVEQPKILDQNISVIPSLNNQDPSQIQKETSYEQKNEMSIVAYKTLQLEKNKEIMLFEIKMHDSLGDGETSLRVFDNVIKENPLMVQDYIINLNLLLNQRK